MPGKDYSRSNQPTASIYRADIPARCLFLQKHTSRVCRPPLVTELSQPMFQLLQEPEGAAAWLLSRTEYSDQLLSAAALIVAELREAVLAEAQFTCSAGIAHNKMLAKLASNMHKPAQQTIVPLAAIPELYEDLPLKKL